MSEHVWILFVTLSVGAGGIALWCEAKKNTLASSLFIAACTLNGMFAGMYLMRAIQGATP